MLPITRRPPSRLRACAARQLSTLLPRKVQIYEVGARDGLQNEPTVLSPRQRIAFIERLSQTGVAAVEAAAFVNPKRVPQMGGAAEVMSGVPLDTPGVAYPVLVPNLKGFEAACASGATRVAVMAAASETFSRNNVNSSIAQATERALEIAAEAAPRGVAVRGYLSCALGCPFEGAVPPELVASLALELYNGGCYEVAISDTIGTGTPGSMARVLQLTLAAGVPVERLAVHCHDTYGQALANILTALQHGVATIDSSAAGLGGCPFAGPGAAGNVATEDVIFMLDGLGIDTGVDFDAVAECGAWIVEQLGRANASKAGLASLRRREHGACLPIGGATLSLGGRARLERGNGIRFASDAGVGLRRVWGSAAGTFGGGDAAGGV